MFGFIIVYEPRGGFWGICSCFTVKRLGDNYLGDVRR
jgi:hypothetical protein